MSPTTVELTGTLQADGTLVPDEKPNLPPGRVRIVVQSLESPSPPAKESLVAFVLRSRRELEAAGSHFMSDEEVQSHLDWLRESDAIDELLRQTEPKTPS